MCINHNCYLYMPSWCPDLVNKLISISTRGILCSRQHGVGSYIYFIFPLVKRNRTHRLPDHLKDFILESFEMSKESNTSQKLSESTNVGAPQTSTHRIAANGGVRLKDARSTNTVAEFLSPLLYNYHSPVLFLSSSMTIHKVFNKSNTTGTTNGTGTVYPSGAPVFTPIFSSVFSFLCSILSTNACLPVEQEQLNLPGAPVFTPIISGVRVSRTLVFCVVLYRQTCAYVLFLLAF